MANWCNAGIRVTGKPKDIKDFCRLFVFDEDEGKDTKRKYFARSFAFMKWKDFKKEYLGGKTAEFSIDFAWSGWSCLIEGYPNKKELVTLEWGCEKYNVEVEIDTEEGGFGFE